MKYDPAHVQAGLELYVSNCVFCHGVPGVDRGGNIRNLGYVAPEVLANLDRQVFNGPFVSDGMPDFTGKLTADEVTRIAAFIQATADSIRKVKLANMPVASGSVVPTRSVRAISAVQWLELWAPRFPLLDGL